DRGRGQWGTPDGAHLHSRFLHQLLGLDPAVPLSFGIQRRPRIRRGQRDLDGGRVDFASEADRLLDGLTRLAGQPEDEGAVDGDPEVFAVAREAARKIRTNALFDVVEDLLVARLVADEHEPEAIVLEDLEGFVRDVGLGVDRPGHAEPAQALGDGLRPRQVVGERIIVEEELLDLREQPLRKRHLLGDVLYATGTVPLSADRLGPEKEGALGATPASRVEGDGG